MQHPDTESLCGCRWPSLGACGVAVDCTDRADQQKPVMGYLAAYAVAFASLLAGASVVHLIYKPDLVMPH